MYRYKQNLETDRDHNKKTQQPKTEAWSVRKPSTHRIRPYTKQETSQLLKADDPSKEGMTLIKPKSPNTTKSSKLLGAVRAALVQESRNFNVQLKALEPTIKSLSPRHRTPPPPPPETTHHQFRKPKVKSNAPGGQGLGQYSPLFSTEDITALPVPSKGPGPTGTPGEKLITIGGYIVSLQPTPENVSSAVRPRVSSDKEGLELEVKILGCHPNDIKFEKRYDTLIVIGISSSPSKRAIEERKSTPLDYRFVPEGKLRDERVIRSAILGSRAFQQNLLGQTDHFDEIHEVINIFVPKNVSINQIFISKPDAKGRIFVKGP